MNFSYTVLTANTSVDQVFTGRISRMKECLPIDKKLVQKYVIQQEETMQNDI